MHMKSENMLHCPSSKCPFVSECKHHFEDHLREYHFGPKPFKTSTALTTLVVVASQQSKSEVEVANSISVTGPFKSPQPEEEECLGLDGQPISGCPFNPIANSISVTGPFETSKPDEIVSFELNGPAHSKPDSTTDSSQVSSSLQCKFYKTILIQIDLFCIITSRPAHRTFNFYES